MYSRNATEEGEQEERTQPRALDENEPDYDPEIEMEALIASWWSDSLGEPLNRSLPRLGMRIADALEQAYIAGARGRGLARYSDDPPPFSHPED